MLKRLFARTLREELPALVADGVLDEEAAERLRARYQVAEEGTGRRWALVVFAVLGSLLIGAGIILLVGHNWEDFTRPTRAGLSYALLALGQGVAAWVLVREKRGLPWREGSALFAQLAAGACLALISQTYHITTDVAAFVLVWMLMTIPLVYLLEAAAPAIVYLVGIVFWVAEIRDGRGAGDSTWFWYWVLLALALPFVAAALRRERNGLRTVWLLWAAAVTVAYGTAIGVARADVRLWMPLWAALAGAYYLAGKSLTGNDGELSLWRSPLSLLGGAGLTVLAFVLTFGDAWRALHRGSGHLSAAAKGFGSAMLPAAAFMGITLLLLGQALARRHRDRLVLGLLPIFVWAGWSITHLHWGDTRLDQPLALLFNAYVLLIGVWQLRKGIRELAAVPLNRGLLVVSALIVARFLDFKLGYITRGVAFILLGVAFLVTNVVIARRRKGIGP